MTDDTMIERVARAIYESLYAAEGGVWWGVDQRDREAHWFPLGRAAIEAMRLPTDEMVAVGADSIARTTHAPDNGPPLVFTAHASFTTMIAAALSESETGEG